MEADANFTSSQSFFEIPIMDKVIKRQKRLGFCTLLTKTFLNVVTFFVKTKMEIIVSKFEKHMLTTESTIDHFFQNQE